jgi:hypothetical protein
MLLFATACTASSPSPSASPTASPAVPTVTAEPTASPTPEPDVPLVFGAPLPAGCPAGDASPTQTIAFVASGRAWALSPAGRLTCLFEIDDPGPFVWGPQGDRVLLGGMEVRFFDGTSVVVEPASDVFDFGRPIGKALVWHADGAGSRKYSFDEEAVERLPELPKGHYRDIAYHPSGLALALSVEEPSGTPGIYLSTNEGERPKRIVVGLSATDFPSVDFTADGRFLLYLADHKGDFSQLHLIDLAAPNELENLWKSPAGIHADGLVLPPGLGDNLAFTLGTACDDAQAVWGSVNEVTPVLPAETRPTVALGFLDVRRLLVGVRDCETGTMDLVVAREGAGPVTAALGVETAAARSDGPDEAAPLDPDLVGEVREFG